MVHASNVGQNVTAELGPTHILQLTVPPYSISELTSCGREINGCGEKRKPTKKKKNTRAMNFERQKWRDRVRQRRKTKRKRHTYIHTDGETSRHV